MSSFLSGLGSTLGGMVGIKHQEAGRGGWALGRRWPHAVTVSSASGRRPMPYSLPTRQAAALTEVSDTANYDHFWTAIIRHGRPSIKFRQSGEDRKWGSRDHENHTVMDCVQNRWASCSSEQCQSAQWQAGPAAWEAVSTHPGSHVGGTTPPHAQQFGGRAPRWVGGWTGGGQSSLPAENWWHLLWF